MSTKYLVTDQITGIKWDATDRTLRDVLHGIVDTAEGHFPGTILTADVLLARLERGDHYGYLEADLAVTVRAVTE